MKAFLPLIFIVFLLRLCVCVCMCACVCVCVCLCACACVCVCVYAGVYISKTSYVRQGEHSVDGFYKPYHTVTYYRFLRFFPDGEGWW